MSEKWLIRLMDCKNENVIAAYFTENPSENLKTFYFCKEHDLGINIPDDVETQYTNKTFGSIDEIKVGFGSHINFSYIDVWLENIY